MSWWEPILFITDLPVPHGAGCSLHRHMYWREPGHEGLPIAVTIFHLKRSEYTKNSVICLSVLTVLSMKSSGYFKEIHATLLAKITQLVSSYCKESASNLSNKSSTLIIERGLFLLDRTCLLISTKSKPASTHWQCYDEKLFTCVLGFREGSSALHPRCV